MKNDLKILYFLDYPHSVGGSNKVLLTQAYIMQQSGAEVKIVIPNDKKNTHAPEYDFLCEKYKLAHICSQYSIAACMEAIDILDALDRKDSLYAMISEWKPDIIHSAQLNIAVELASRLSGIPHLMNIYQADEEEFNIKWMDCYPHYHCSDSILMSERWKKGLNIASRCIRVAYEPKEPQNIRNEKDDGLVIVTTGLVCERKNQLEIIKMVQKCLGQRIRIRLYVLGKNDTKYGEMCKEYVKENELENEVFFEGFVHNVEDYLSRADLFVLSSTVESYPGVIVECMANHVMVLSTPVAGVPELLKNEQNCLLSEGYDCDSLYKTFLVFLDLYDKKIYQEILSNAYNTYLENHSYKVVGKQLDDYYRWIMNDFKTQTTPIPDISFFENYKRDSLYRETTHNLWMLSHMKRKMQGKKIAIWGAGHYGEIAIEWFADDFDIAGFVDVSKKGIFKEYAIIELKEALELADIFIVAVQNMSARLEIMDILDRNGLVRNETYFLMCNDPLRI